MMHRSESERRASGNGTLLIKLLVIVAVLFYMAWTEARIDNLQRVTDLAYDAGQCCVTARQKVQVTDCFERRGYKVRKFDANSDFVPAKLKLEGLTLRSFGVIIEYDSDAKVRAYRLSSNMGAL